MGEYKRGMVALLSKLTESEKLRKALVKDLGKFTNTVSLMAGILSVRGTELKSLSVTDDKSGSAPSPYDSLSQSIKTETESPALAADASEDDLINAITQRREFLDLALKVLAPSAASMMGNLGSAKATANPDEPTSSKKSHKPDSERIL